MFTKETLLFELIFWKDYVIEFIQNQLHLKEKSRTQILVYVTISNLINSLKRY